MATSTSTAAGSRRRARRAQKFGSDERPGAGQLLEQQSGDQESGEHEEHVDADEPAAERGDAQVEQQHGHDGDGPHALDVGPEVVERDSPELMAHVAPAQRLRGDRRRMPAGAAPSRDGAP